MSADTSASWIADYLQPGRRLVGVGAGVLSAGDPDTPGSRYDRQARTYDLVVGNRFYNRLVWGNSIASYAAFAAAAVADADGPLLDVGCGTAVFTADSYRRTDRPLIFVDRSVGMLARAAKRLAGVDRVAFVQADLFDLPFHRGAFTTVSCHGVLHLFENSGQVLRVLRSQMAPGGSLYATSLVAETSNATRMLRLLHRTGEAAAPPRRTADLSMLARAALGDMAELRQRGRHGVSPLALTRPTPLSISHALHPPSIRTPREQRDVDPSSDQHDVDPFRRGIPHRYARRENASQQWSSANEDTTNSDLYELGFWSALMHLLADETKGAPLVGTCGRRDWPNCWLHAAQEGSCEHSRSKLRATATATA